MKRNREFMDYLYDKRHALERSKRFTTWMHSDQFVGADKQSSPW